jgi:hypothetical protein
MRPLATRTPTFNQEQVEEANQNRVLRINYLSQLGGMSRGRPGDWSKEDNSH